MQCTLPHCQYSPASEETPEASEAKIRGAKVGRLKSRGANGETGALETVLGPEGWVRGNGASASDL